MTFDERGVRHRVALLVVALRRMRPPAGSARLVEVWLVKLALLYLARMELIGMLTHRHHASVNQFGGEGSAILMLRALQRYLTQKKKPPRTLQ